MKQFAIAAVLGALAFAAAAATPAVPTPPAASGNTPSAQPLPHIQPNARPAHPVNTVSRHCKKSGNRTICTQ